MLKGEGRGENSPNQKCALGTPEPEVCGQSCGMRWQSSKAGGGAPAHGGDQVRRLDAPAHLQKNETVILVVYGCFWLFFNQIFTVTHCIRVICVTFLPCKPGGPGFWGLRCKKSANSFGKHRKRVVVPKGVASHLDSLYLFASHASDLFACGLSCRSGPAIPRCGSERSTLADVTPGWILNSETGLVLTVARLAQW